MNRTNYYGSLCTQMYEILHANAPQDELDFYLSYAQKGMRILEPLCGSGRFLIPFTKKGFDVVGVDSSQDMLSDLHHKMPAAKGIRADILKWHPKQKFDYIYIPSGSVSLFTDAKLCRKMLAKFYKLLTVKGKFVFAVDTVAVKTPDDKDYKEAISVDVSPKERIVLLNKNQYNEKTQTEFSPSIYELVQGKKVLRREKMDFQTHLYRVGEMEKILQQIGFSKVKTYSDFKKDPADENSEAFIFECEK